MATKAELAAQLGDPTLADQYSRKELVAMAADLDAAEHIPVSDTDSRVRLYRDEDGAPFDAPAQAAAAAVAGGGWSYNPPTKKTKRKKG